MELSLIQSKIYEIRGQRVMLDFDLAGMYGVETRVLNQAVKRNVDRFPDDFMFKLSQKEWEYMLSQIVMTYPVKRPKTAVPLAFTELGVAMLSSVLNSKTAIQINMRIMRAFVAVRQLLINPPFDRVTELQNEIKELKEYIEEVFSDYNDINEDTQMQLELINQTLAELQAFKKIPETPRRPIGFIKPNESGKG
jgi:cell shape-determining protein MreC